MLTLKIGSTEGEVRLLKAWLNGVLTPSPNLPLDRPFGPNTKAAVKRFQQSKPGLTPDGSVGPLTWRELALAARSVRLTGEDSHRAASWDLYWPIYLRNLRLARRIDPARFRSAFNECIRDGSTAPGLEEFLGLMNEDSSLINADLRWVAYMMATAKWESAHTFSPVFEHGCTEMYPGDCPQYDAAVPRTKYHQALACPNADKTHYPKLSGISTCPNHRTQHIYHGRGYIQLTWYVNYAGMEDRLGIPLVHYPSHALLPENAYKVIVSWFRSGPPPGAGHAGVPLSNYINDHQCDYYNARDLVNGDKATVQGWTSGVSNGAMIETYAKKLEVCLAYSMGWPTPMTFPMGPGPTGW